jgi:hypothetical protein
MIKDYLYTYLCSLVMVLEEPSWMSEGRSGVMDELVRGSRDLSRVERKVDKAGTRNSTAEGNR